MNKKNAEHIDELLEDSGLFISKENSQKTNYAFDFSDEVILITGAAGSIGSELSRHLIKSKYKKLILVDVAESPLYELIKELEFEDINKVQFTLLNITEVESLQYLFEKHKPSMVFHTAAYKHVPLMEQYPFQVLKTNIIGTKLLADLSLKHHVKKFIFISTDKAVNPINVMGMSKRICENYFNFLNKRKETSFITTRFGNILGSNGSFVPLIKKQIESGVAITITDKTITRYFISKYKACHLILKLATKDNFENNTYTFNMGKPIKITQIVDRLILKCDNTKGELKIKFTGLRFGEKLHEDIVSDNEILIPTNDKDIMAVEQKVETALNTIDFEKLLKLTPNMANEEIKLVLKRYL